MNKSIPIMLCLLLPLSIMATTYQTKFSGVWSSDLIWLDGVSPGTTSGDTIIISHHISLDVNFQSVNGCYIRIDSSGEICGHQVLALDNSVMDVYGALNLDVFQIVSSQVTTYVGSETVLTQYGQISGTGAYFTVNGVIAVGPWFECARSGATSITENNAFSIGNIRLFSDSRYLYYQLELLPVNTSVIIFDRIGREITRENISSTEGQLELPNNSTNLYIIQFFVDDKLVSTQKVLHR